MKIGMKQILNNPHTVYTVIVSLMNTVWGADRMFKNSAVIAARVTRRIHDRSIFLLHYIAPNRTDSMPWWIITVHGGS